MAASRYEDLFRRRAIESLAARLDGRPVAVLPRPWVWLAVLVLAFVTAAGIFAAVTDYARKETVRGWLVAEQGMVRLTQDEPVVVVRVVRAVGDTVRRGDPLLYLSGETALEDGSGSTQRILDELHADRGEVERRRMLVREQAAADARALAAEAQDIDDELERLANRIRAQEQRIDRASRRLQDLQAAHASGAVSDRELLRQRDEVAALQQERDRLEQDRIRLGRERRTLGKNASRLEIDMQQSLSALSSEQSGLQQRISATEARRLQALLAPVDGTVATLGVAAGSTARRGQLLASILPAGHTLAADVFVPSRAIGLLRRGQRVRLLFDAFPHQHFGPGAGEISAIDGYVLLPGDLPPTFGLREAAYRVRIALASEWMMLDGEAYALRPGMLLAAELILERRSVLEWLLAPLRRRLSA